MTITEMAEWRYTCKLALIKGAAADHPRLGLPALACLSGADLETMRRVAHELALAEVAHPLRPIIDLAKEFAAARFAGLSHCTCGRYQYSALLGHYIARDAIGEGLRDYCDGEPIAEAVCSIGGCGDWCQPGGKIVPLAELGLDFADAEVAPHEEVGC